MVADGSSLNSVAQKLNREGVRIPYSRRRGVKSWNVTFIRDCIVADDVYKPHTINEVAALVTPEVASKLNPDKSYGIWWFNRRSSKTTQVSVSDENGKKHYKTRAKYTARPREEWVAVPVPASGVPREVVDAARASVKGNRAPSNAGRRHWELSGGIARCGLCGRVMNARTTANRGRPIYFYYTCSTRHRKGSEGCANCKYLAAAKVEDRVWEAVFGLLQDPEQLRDDLNAMIEQERNSIRDNPDRANKLWVDKIAELDRRRTRYQEMAADDLITFDELRARLYELDEVRATAERELEALRKHRQYMVELERDRDAMLSSLEGVVPEALESLSSEERRQLYKILRLSIFAHPDGSLKLSGAFGENLDISKNRTARPLCSV